MSFIDSITNIFIQKNINLSRKISFAIIILILLFLINDYMGFTYYKNIESKASSIEKLNVIINDSTTDSISKVYLIKMRKDVLYRKTFLETASEYLRGLEFYSNNNPNRQIEQIEQKDSYKNSFWFLISTTSIFVSIIVAIFAAFLFDKSDSLALFQRIGILIGLSVAFLVYGLLIFIICSAIPLIDESNYVYNYIINFIIQILSVGIPVYFTERKKAK